MPGVHDLFSRFEQALALYVQWCERGRDLAPDRLLEAHPDLRDLLEPLLLEEHTEDRAGSRLGDYELLREIGRGGMGVVYEARHCDLGRLAAVKVLPAQLTARPGAVARFRREALAAARLQHPGIVGIHEIGQADGLHFFAMDLVDGGPLPARPKAVREVADWIAQAAEALDHAHRAGVVHRDVKPGNLLLTREGRVVITDFGLAHEQGLPSLTMTGAFLGTPHYVSPEQARGLPVDGRTDVFALGATLYELLTCRRPFEASTTQQVLARVVGDDPVDPRRWNAAVPRDLAAVVQRMLEKDPARRYATAAACAADLRAFLAGRTVVARPVGRGRRTLRWARRHPARAGLCASLLLGIPALTGLVGYQFANAPILSAGREELKRQRVEAILAEGYLALAEEEWDLAFSHLRPAHALAPDNIEALAGMALAMEKLEGLEMALAFLDRHAVAAASVDLQGLRAQLTDGALGEPHPADSAFACFQRGLVEYDRAKPIDDRQGLKRAAHAFSRAVHRTAIPRPMYHILWARAAVAADDRGAAENALEAINKLWPDSMAASFTTAMVLQGRDPEMASALNRKVIQGGGPYAARAAYNLGILLDKTKDREAAAAAYRTCLEHNPRHLQARNNLGLVLEAAGDLAGAEQCLRETVAVDPGFAKAHSNLGRLLRRRGQMAEAEAAFRAALAARPDYAIGHYNLGNLLQDTDRSEEAVGHYRQAVSIDPSYQRANNNLGNAFTSLGQLAEAAAAYQRALELAPEQVIPMVNLGRTLVRLGRYAEGKPYLQRAIALAPDLAAAWYGLADLLVRPDLPEELSDPMAALQAAEKAVELDGGKSEAYLQTLELARTAAAGK